MNTNKILAFLFTAVTSATLISCIGGKEGEPASRRAYARFMVAAATNASGTRTVYTAPTTGLFEYDRLGEISPKFTISDVNMPDNSRIGDAYAENLLSSQSESQVDYVFTSGPETEFVNFSFNTPVNLSATLSLISWELLATTNASAEIEFASGTRMTAFGANLGFFTNSTITDIQNPGQEPFNTFEATSNNVYILLSKYPTANVYLYQTTFDKNTSKKVDMVIEDVEFSIDTENGLLLLSKEVAIPCQMLNNVKGDPLPEYRIHNLKCAVPVGFQTAGTLTFNCANRYEFSSQLVEAMPR